MGVAAATADLHRLIFDVEAKEQIASLVSLASRERVIGKILADAVDYVGKEGLITVEEGAHYGLELEPADGMRFEQGYLSEYFVTDRERDECVLEHPYLLLVDHVLSEVGALVPILDLVIATGRPLAVIAHDVDGAALNTLVRDKTSGKLISVAVRAPETGDRRTSMMQDIAVLTGAQVVGSRLPLGQVTLDTLGQASKTVTTVTRTTIVDSAGDANEIAGRVNQIRAAIDRGGPSAELDHLRIRLARLAGGIAVIKVGGTGEADVSQRIRTIRRAITMMLTAINEGLVSGGGAAFVHVGAGLRTPAGLSGDLATGFEVVVKALNAPCEALVRNAGHDGGAIVQQLRDKPDRVAYDVVSGEFVTAYPEALIDSAALPRVALAAAAEAVGRFLMMT
jgi:chaperonin GroEL